MLVSMVWFVPLICMAEPSDLLFGTVKTYRISFSVLDYNNESFLSNRELWCYYFASGCLYASCYFIKFSFSIEIYTGPIF